MVTVFFEILIIGMALTQIILATSINMGSIPVQYRNTSYKIMVIITKVV